MKRYTYLLFLLLFQTTIQAQQAVVGAWVDHLPYQTGTSVATDGELVYCGTKTGLFTYNSEDNSIQTYSKVNLLNDVNLAQLAYSKEHKTLIIVYDNSNIDILHNNTVTNIPFLKNSNQSSKTINEIQIEGEKAYLSFGFGVMVINLVQKEIEETYKFGTNGNAINVNSTIVENGKLYAATNSGYYIADLTKNLLDFGNWEKQLFKSSSNILKLFKNEFVHLIVSGPNNLDSAFKKISDSYEVIPSLNGLKYVSISKLVNNEFIYHSANDALLLRNDLTIRSRKIFNSNNVVGSVLTDNNRLFVLNGFDPLNEFRLTDYQPLLSTRPDGPFEKAIFDMDVSENFVWAVGGGVDGAYNSAFKGGRIYQYNKQNWRSYIDFFDPSLKDVFDLVSVSINPDKESEVFFGSWGGGLIQWDAALPFNKYDTTNSSLSDRKALKGWIGIGESEFDQDGNFWVTNTYTTNALSVRKKNGEWVSFDLTRYMKGPETAIYDLLIDQNGYKWIVLEKDNEIIVFDDRQTIDDKSDDRGVVLKAEAGSGNLPGNRGLIIEEDRNGVIWLGSSNGIAVHYNPGNIFDSQNMDFERIVFFDGENNEEVLQDAAITALAINGDNQKWIGTDDSGVLLLSEDGKETLLEFNEGNSPLLSNSINTIAIDDFTGEVYIATGEGLVSYRASSTRGQENFSDVKVFPNPVAPDYNGPITIQGLVSNSTVKITDVNGTLINEINSQGGTAVWNGNNFSGRRASTGVYLIFLSGEDEDGDLKTEIGKIMFIN